MALADVAVKSACAVDPRAAVEAIPRSYNFAADILERNLAAGRGGYGVRSGGRRGCAKLTKPRRPRRGAAGRGPAWLRRLTGGQESRSSNLLVPTTFCPATESELSRIRRLVLEQS